MSWDKYVIDATLSDRARGLCFVPLDGEGNAVLGMNFIGEEPPAAWGEFLGVIHLDGPEACEKWCSEHEDILEKLKQKWCKELK